MSDIDWLAGLIEGEGCFYADRKLPRIQIAMTDKDIIAKASFILIGYESFNVQIPKKNRPGTKTVYLVSIGGKKAIAWMVLLYPLMGTRRKAKIRELLGKDYFDGEQLK